VEGPQRIETSLVVHGLPNAFVDAIVRDPEGLKKDVVLRLEVVRRTPLE